MEPMIQSLMSGVIASTAWRRVLTACAVALAVPSAGAQDAARGSGLYLQLPGGLAACVSCHGPDPAANRNNLLRAAGQPVVLLKALNAIGVMGYLKSELSDADIADLAAYLDTVTRAANDASSTVWPRSIELGALPAGGVSPEHTVWLRNLTAQPLPGVAPRVAGGRLALRHDCPATLAPGALCSASVRALAPLAGESIADALVWGGASVAVVGLTARGASGPVAQLSFDPATLDWGSSEVGSNVTQRLRVLNAGTADATLGVSTFTGPTAGAFSSSGSCAAGTVLMPGTACTVDLFWRVGAPVTYEAALQWRGDGTNPAPLRLLASGLPASAPPPTAQPTPPVTGGAAATDNIGGGCTSGMSGQRADAGTTLWAAWAIGALAFRSRKPRTS